MSKWLAHFLQKTCQTSTDKTDTTLEMREVSVMSVSTPAISEKNSLVLSNVSVMSVHDLGTFEKNNVISDDEKDKQQAINISPYIDLYNERAGIYEFEASDTSKNRAEAEWLATNYTLGKFMEDTKTPLQSRRIPEFLEEFYETAGFNLRSQQ